MSTTHVIQHQKLKLIEYLDEWLFTSLKKISVEKGSQDLYNESEVSTY